MSDTNPMNVLAATTIERTVFIVSDGTGITAETFSHSVLSQFDGVQFKQIRVPFVDTLEKADLVVQRINHVANTQEGQPIAFITLVDSVISARIKTAKALFLDLLLVLLSHLSKVWACAQAILWGSLTKAVALRNTEIELMPSITAWRTTTDNLSKAWRRPM